MRCNKTTKKKTQVGYKWIFTINYKVNGTMERYKTHLVAKRFIQAYRINKTKKFAHMAKLNTIQVLLSLD